VKSHLVIRDTQALVVLGLVCADASQRGLEHRLYSNAMHLCRRAGVTRRCQWCRLRLKCEGTRTETRFRLSTTRTSTFKSAGVSVQSTSSSRGVRISGSNAGYTMFRGSMKGTGYPLHSPVSTLLPLP
jgi:hypothetical protein